MPGVTGVHIASGMSSMSIAPANPRTKLTAGTGDHPESLSTGGVKKVAAAKASGRSARSKRKKKR